MRRTRRLILAFIAIILIVVGITYVMQRSTQARNAPALPAKLSDSISKQAEDWCHEKTQGNRKIVTVCAKEFRQLASGTRMELEHVTLQLYNKDGKTFDEVKSARADFDVPTGKLFSEGEVEITTGISMSEPLNRSRLVHIKTSGVSFDSNTGSASTERPADFKFERGEGRSVGARYDSNTRELQMQKDVKLAWWGAKPEDQRMEVEGGSVTYKESESKAILTPWSKFKRGTLSIEAGMSVVSVGEKSVQEIEALQAKGSDSQPKRRIEFAAEHLRVSFDEKGVVQKVVGDRNSQLVSIADSGRTAVNSRRLDMDFEQGTADNILKKAYATGGAKVETVPAVLKGKVPGESRVVRSEIISMYMRQGGEEIDRVETESPGTVDFVPNAPVQRARHLAGERLTMTYGAANQPKQFRATKASTRTEGRREPGKPAKQQPPALTWSDELLAEFNPANGELEKLEQWENFRYEEGDRKARSTKAIFTPGNSEILLTGSARFWEPTGSTSAESIVMNQASGDMDAKGNVNSTRLPEKDKKKTGMLSGDEPVQAKAATMMARDQNRRIVYEGDALMWQGSNRLQATRITIERESGALLAEGKVVSQLLDQSDKTKKVPEYTVVESPRMTYSDKERVARYTGGSVLRRGTTVVNAKDITAFLKQGENAGSSLDRAHADGAVKIVQTAPDRTKTGFSEHAEYYVADERVVLNGGAPKLIDSVKGTTQGKQLTYFAKDERLLVEGAGESKLIRN